MDRWQVLFERLKGLVAIPATSGFGQGIARRLLEEMRPLADRVEVDAFGNVYGYVDGAPGRPARHDPGPQRLGGDGRLAHQGKRVSSL